MVHLANVLEPSKAPQGLIDGCQQIQSVNLVGTNVIQAQLSCRDIYFMMNVHQNQFNAIDTRPRASRNFCCDHKILTKNSRVSNCLS